jgi:hypothetical protein
MKAHVETKAEIRVIKINKKSVDIEVRMPDKNEIIQRTLREGESYFNTVTLDMELPFGDMTSYKVSS